MTVAIICTSLLGLLLFGLGLTASLQRQRYKAFIGHDTSPTDPVHQAVRAHANTAEFAPFLAILFLWHGSHAPQTWILWVIVIATLSRFMLAGALLWWPTLDQPNPPRFVGALTTYICGLILSAALLWNL